MCSLIEKLFLWVSSFFFFFFLLSVTQQLLMSSLIEKVFISFSHCLLYLPSAISCSTFRHLLPSYIFIQPTYLCPLDQVLSTTPHAMSSCYLFLPYSQSDRHHSLVMGKHELLPVAKASLLFVCLVAWVSKPLYWSVASHTLHYACPSRARDSTAVGRQTSAGSGLMVPSELGWCPDCWDPCL